MMKKRMMDRRQISMFQAYLQAQERSRGTVEKYVRDVAAFYGWLDGRAVTRDVVAAWKEELRARGKAAVTVNGAMAALHSFFGMMGWAECRVKYNRIQRKVFRDESKELTQQDFDRLVNAARSMGREQMALILQTIGATGIRVSELMYITMEAVRKGKAEISLKGKTRVIMLPDKLCKRLLSYAKKMEITSGVVFRNAKGQPITRYQVWAAMKQIGKAARVALGKVFPHNLRHLFATTFYRLCHDIVKLADVLGHSSIETTRIYLISTGKEHARMMNRLNFIT